MIPVLSIRQPWAWLIVNGHKDIENRTWPTKFKGRFLVHAGKTPPDWTDDDYEFCEKEYGVVVPRQGLPLGGLVGEAQLIACVDKSPSSPWFQGPYGFMLRDQKALPFVPMRGQRGFFNVAADALPQEYRP